MLLAWASGWCAGLGFMNLINQNWLSGIICLVLAIIDGLVAFDSKYW